MTRRQDAPEDDDALIREALARAEPVIIGVRARGLSPRTFPKVERLRLPGTDEGAERMRRWLPGGANRGGRTDERERRLAEYRSAILALDEKHYQPAEITARRVLAHLYRSSPAQLWNDVSDPRIGGWKRFRDEVLRSR